MELHTGTLDALVNPHRGDDSIDPPAEDVRELHRALPGHEPTPLVELPRLADSIGVRSLHVKDESKRFGLNAFKSLGASYAMYRVAKRRWEAQHDESCVPSLLDTGDLSGVLDGLTFCAATAGNHGRAVAWMAQQLGCRAVVFVPSGTRPSRIENIRGYGADVEVIGDDYDATVLHAERESRAHGWQVIADFGYEGYTEIPRWIQSGYSTMFREIAEQLEAADRPLPDVVALQIGGGCFAAGAVRAMRHGWGRPPRLVGVEPREAACMYASAQTEEGHGVVAAGTRDTICSCLNVATPSLTAWPVLRCGIDVFVGVADDAVIHAMRRLRRPGGEDPHLVAGESGAAGFAGIAALLADESCEPIRAQLGLDTGSGVLVINTEGDTDPERYRAIVRGE